MLRNCGITINENVQKVQFNPTRRGEVAGSLKVSVCDWFWSNRSGPEPCALRGRKQKRRTRRDGHGEKRQRRSRTRRDGHGETGHCLRRTSARLDTARRTLSRLGHGETDTARRTQRDGHSETDTARRTPETDTLLETHSALVQRLRASPRAGLRPLISNACARWRYAARCAIKTESVSAAGNNAR